MEYLHAGYFSVYITVTSTCATKTAAKKYRPGFLARTAVVLHFSYISQIFLHILILYTLYHSVFAAIQDKLPVDGAVTMLGLGVFQILFHFLSRYNKNGEVPAITLRRKPDRFWMLMYETPHNHIIICILVVMITLLCESSVISRCSKKQVSTDSIYILSNISNA